MHVVISGASRGVGAALKSRFEAQGHEVTGTSRSGDGDLHAVEMTDPASIRDFAASLSGRAVDLLVCNAGIFRDRNERIADGYPAELWAEELAVNVTAPFLCVQALLPNLRDAGGKVAIISSQMGSSTLANGNALIYRASKAAALNLGLNLSAALKSDGIAVGIYHPGWVRTDMGGGSASISPEESAVGLAARFAALDLAHTGVFETWDGREHAV